MILCFLSIPAITCSALSTISNGVISYVPDTTDPYDYLTNAVFSCNTGFYLVGTSARVCEGDGTSPQGVWSGTTPLCRGKARVNLNLSCIPL